MTLFNIYSALLLQDFAENFDWERCNIEEMDGNMLQNIVF